MVFLWIGAAFALLPISIGFAAVACGDVGPEWTFAGYTALGLAVYCDLLGLLWQVAS